MAGILTSVDEPGRVAVNMSIQDRQKQLIQTFQAFHDWEERYKKLIEFGKQLPPLPEDLKTEDLKVKGCQSQVWIQARLEQGRVQFQGDSDALLVKGLVAIILYVYSDSTPQEILTTPPDFIQEIGLESKLSPSRANGVFSMIKQIQYYAMAYQALISR